MPSPKPPARRKKAVSLWVWLARIATLFGLTSNILPTLLGLPTTLRQLQSGGSGIEIDSWEALTLHTAALSNGYSLSVWASAIITADMLIMACYWSVGLLLFWRYSDRLIGWLVPYTLAGLGVGTLLVDHWAQGLATLPAQLVPYVEITAIAIWPAFMVALFLFPDGRPVPEWMKYLLPLPFLMFLLPYLLLGDQEMPAMAQLLLFVVLGGGVLSQIYRYRKISNSSQRQQTKWILIAVTVLVLSFMLPSSLLQPALENSFWGTLAFAFLPRVVGAAFLPIAMAISLTRYRLWDVDSLVNRALIYGVLTTVLAGVFAASTVVLNQVLSGLFGSQSTSLSPVASAVLVATIFQPTRKGIEEWIAKRLNPNKADLSTGLVEIGPDFWSLIQAKDLYAAVSRHVAEKLGSLPVAVYLAAADGAYELVEARPSPAALPKTLTLSPESLNEFRHKHVDAIEGGEPFVLLVPLYVPDRHQLELRGILACGPRPNQRGYAGEELKALYALGGQVGTALLALSLRKNKPSK